jgi:hypothetical protein
MKTLKPAILSLLATCAFAIAQTYNESGGLVVMEIENTGSPLGLWQKQTALAGHSGTGYLQFLGNTYENGPATSPLEFQFKINQAGLYYLHLHCAKETHDGRTDVANDCYVRVEGDYNAGPGPYDSHGNNASLALLQSDTKYFGGATNAWKWENGQNSSGSAGNLDPGGETNKRVAVYDFKAGQTYKLVVSGRSKFFRINRIVFRHANTAAATAQNLSTPESSFIPLVRPPAGRLALVADGNSPDPDDIGAIATILGILKGSGQRHRLVHLSHSCDLDPFRNTGTQTIDATNELRRQNKLDAVCAEGIGFFGPFPNLADYYNCRTEQTAAVNDLKNAINASSAGDPLWIIVAGEPDIIGYALQAADASKRQFVNVVSHHPANDNSGDFFSWAQILAFGVTEHQIGDQNVGLQVLISSALWDWAQNHPNPAISWIWNQLKYAEQDGVVTFQTNKFDCSDAGMVYWWITGADAGGNNASTPNEIRPMLLAAIDGDSVTGDLKKWHKVTLSWNGPSSSETASTNPFSDYRLNVTFSHAGSGKSYLVPGYFAADGNAAETSAHAGNVWRVHFTPNETGEWTYAVSFRSGSDIAIDPAAGAGASAGFFDGDSGSIEIAATDKTGRDLRGKGRLRYVGKHHLQFAETGEYFLKAGVDAPENLLAYDDFDDTPNDPNGQPNLRKSWSPHAADYDAATASAFTWQGGKGSEILGALRYLAQKGLNVFSFLTFSLDGDDDNVFPHRLKSTVSAYESVADNQRWGNANGVHKDRFDVSKMDQWERVFEYGTRQGMYLHFKTQETENDGKMDGGALGRERKLYYRELVARFGHHLALNWNLGEENTNTTAQQQAFARWFHDNDPYRHHVVLHTYPLQKDAVYTPLLGAASKLTGLSMQGNLANFSDVFQDTLTWVQNSAGAGTPWVVACDEPGDAQHALRPVGDEGNSWIDGRRNALWGNVLAGGAGVEFYFGYDHAQSDLNCQDFRSRDAFWDYCRHMLGFFRDNGVPFQDMSNANSLVSGSGANANRCLAKAGQTYVVQLYNGGAHTLDLSTATGDFTVRWLDPRNGGPLQQGSVTSVTGGAVVSLGTAPSAPASDWIVLVTKAQAGGGNTTNGVMRGLPNDADIRDDGAIVNLSATSLVPGRSGSNGGFDRSTHFVFQLPDLGPLDSPFLGAGLGFNVESTSTTPPGADLYGLGRRASPVVVAGDYYGQTSVPDPTDATLIQTNLLHATSGTGSKGTGTSAALASYLNAQYDGGNGIGQYVFLRLSTSAPVSGLERHFITSADAAGENGPRISYTAVAIPDFERWRLGFNFPPGADRSRAGDPDGDGVNTGIEYLFGLDPTKGSSLSPIRGMLSKTNRTFRYSRRNASLTGADYQIWTSGNLTDWDHDTTASQIPDGNDELQVVLVTLTDHPVAADAMFVQVRACIPELLEMNL